MPLSPMKVSRNLTRLLCAFFELSLVTKAFCTLSKIKETWAREFLPSGFLRNDTMFSIAPFFTVSLNSVMVFCVKYCYCIFRKV